MTDEGPGPRPCARARALVLLPAPSCTPVANGSYPDELDGPDELDEPEELRHCHPPG